MSIDLFQRISFRLTRIAVIIAFIVGILISFIQVTADFGEQRNILANATNEIYDVSRDSATRIVYQLDDYYAVELVNGLKNYQILRAAQLLDDRNEVLASFEIVNIDHSAQLLTKWLIGETTTNSYPLLNEDNLNIGTLVLVTDNHTALQPFYHRAIYILLSGFFRNLALAGILLFVFHFVVTKPLIRLANNLGEIDAANPNQKRISAIANHKGTEIGYIIDTTNGFINAAENHQTSLANLEQQLRTIINTVPLFIYAVDQDNQFLFANANTALHYKKHFSNLSGANYWDVHSTIDEKEASFMISEYESVFLAKKDRQIDDILLTNHDFIKTHFEITFIHFHYFDKSSVLVVMNDITERIESQNAIEKLAYYDALTGLANRTLFQDRLKMDIRRAERFNHFGALLFVDLDKFKLINDTLGHAKGDELLIEVSRKLKMRIRDLDTISRMGGDEFAVSLSELSDREDQAVERAINIAEEFNVILSSEIELAGQGYQISASIGIAFYPQNSNDVPTLLRFADAAMYQAKNAGRHQVKLFEHQMIERMTKQVQLEKEIHHAFDRNEFTIVIQPLYCGLSKTPISAEVLIRWLHPEKGLLGPHEFLDYVESLNLMNIISSTAISQCAQFIKKLDIAELIKVNFRFAINISTLEFYEPDFTQRIISSIKNEGIPLNLFELEITEGIALHDLNLAKEKIRELESVGITVALDDFGTGYSSLSYLKNLNVNKLKIDKSFIDDIETDIQDQKLVDSIIAIADNFEVSVVIEGVENSAQLEWLSKHHNLIYQGYHFSKPLLMNDLLKELSKFDFSK